MSGMTVSAQRYDEAIAQIRVAIKEVEKTSKQFEDQQNSQNMAEYRSAYSLALGMLSIMRTLGMRADIETYILEAHKTKCTSPFLNWES